MTSKEALEQLRKYNGIGLCGDRTLFEPIEKDLEILEILKHLIEFKNGNFSDYIFISFPQKSKEKEIIKEWLDEEQH